MDWTQVLTIVGANIAMVSIGLGTTISLFIHLDKKTNNLIKEMKDEMKDFHGRLCAIEERNKK